MRAVRPSLLASRACLGVMVAVVVLLISSVVRAETKGRAIGFSNLVLRIDADDSLGIDDGKYRVYILEELRKNGFNAVGAENVVFGKDKAEAAELVLGGTVNELECRDVNSLRSCRIGVEWQLLEVATDTVVYKKQARRAVLDVAEKDLAMLPRRLIFGALRSMYVRTVFQEIANKKVAKAPAADPKFKEATYAACATEPKEMPGSSEGLLDGTVVIESGQGSGSGFFLTKGLVLTAAHVVVSDTVKVRTRGGKELVGTPLRINKRFDVALLTVSTDNNSCVPTDAKALATGADLWALGAPAGKALAFSVSRGIVSAVREIDGVRYLQTDTSLNPGNSGGPIVAKAGKAVAIASWKLTGTKVEGLAFGIPMGDALKALGLVEGETTSGSLLKERVVSRKLAKPETLTDAADPVPAMTSLAPTSETLPQPTREVKKGISGGTALVMGGILLSGVGAVLFGLEAGKDEPSLVIPAFLTLGGVGLMLGGVAAGRSRRKTPGSGGPGGQTAKTGTTLGLSFSGRF